MALTVQQGYTPGCIGRITELHADYYCRLAEFAPLEAKIAGGLAALFE